MNTTSLGSRAEQLVAAYLKGQGYQIIDKNWRRPACEIDLIAKKNNIVYFVEVKFRKTGSHGGGLDHITAAKQKQMTHAAHLWIAEADWDGDSRLAAAAVDYDGTQMVLAGFEELV
jgi:putative endonuclease